MRILNVSGFYFLLKWLWLALKWVKYYFLPTLEENKSEWGGVSAFCSAFISLGSSSSLRSNTCSHFAKTWRRQKGGHFPSIYSSELRPILLLSSTWKALAGVLFLFLFFCAQQHGSDQRRGRVGGTGSVFIWDTRGGESEEHEWE